MPYYYIDTSEVKTYYLLPSLRPKPRPRPRPVEVVTYTSHHGPHRAGDRHIYDHLHHSRHALVKNSTGKTLPSDEVRGILNSSDLALSSRDMTRLTITRNRYGGYKVVKG